MEYRQLGKTGLKVSAVGLGCGRLGSVTQTGGSQAALRVIGQALDGGINFFDTADIYGQGASEKLLAQAIKGRRDQIIIATKAGFCLSALGQLTSRVKPLLRQLLRAKPNLSQSVRRVRATQNRQDFSPRYLAGRVEASLRRLQVDALDLFYLHSPPTEILERDEVFEMLESQKRQGKIRHYGVSTRSVADTLLCLKRPGVAALQVELNLLTPAVLSQVLPVSRAANVAVVPRQALAGGLFMRSPAMLRPEDCMAREEKFAFLKNRLEQYEKIAAAVGVHLPQLAMQFLIQLNGVSSVLIGTTNPDHLQEHLTALNRPPLAPAIIAQIHATLGV